MSTTTNNIETASKVIIVAQISPQQADPQRYFWNNGKWDLEDKLATKFSTSEAQRLISDFALSAVQPMTSDSMYTVKKIAA